MKRKVVLYFMVIIVLMLSLVMAVFWGALTQYYEQGMAGTFRNRAEGVWPVWDEGDDLYYRSLEDYSSLIIKKYQYDGAELELLNKKGELIRSSAGFYKKKTYQVDPSVLAYETVSEKEKNEATGETVLAVYTPLLRDGKVAGVLRYSSSLTGVKKTISGLLGYGLLICLGLAVIVFSVSLRLAQSIVQPFKEITSHTRELAKGRFDKKLEKTYQHELGEMAQTLNFMAEEISRTDRLKADFISSISHELRTPLTGIRGWAEMMDSHDGLTKEEMQFGLRVINSESERLAKLVENLLDFSRYEAGRIELVMDEMRLDLLIEEAALQMQKKALAKKVTLELNVIPVSLNADRDKIKQVLLNLMDNSIKFSNHDSVISITQSQKNNLAGIQVIDNGIGITKDNLEHIMDSFYKTDAKSTGAGLGLAIARQIIELHGGSIRIESNYQKGTAVSIQLPLYEPLKKPEKG
ncbi:HAMP domain-containing histidine kinase [Metabacillus sp. GX 13764]|uniref:sensor histidine kinase n=1 Tax=Metabacillus kandeliae TaxID=2900151 RepID=UPI001E2E8E71|nr:HAMP domain-containing sensor histidine kinase [Metabacillus kandeliae]MCD7035422.1 HAMP domain-containing histidine kinase [Metabacillus kandeliae]